MESSRSALDASVLPAAAALEARGVRPPTVLVFSATGLGMLPSRLERGARLPLGQAPDCPPEWRDALLHHGQLEGQPVWLIEDEPSAPLAEAGESAAPRPAWVSGFPIWLAAAAGATVLLTCHAACALGELPFGTLALASDHVNFSGASPLVGIGESRLGPMFPDLSLLHDRALRRDALSSCRHLGLAGAEAVFACTPSPALETPAEQHWFRSAGADVSVQGLAPSLLAAAHAGLGVLAIGVVAARAGERMDIARVAALARELAPALDDLLCDLLRAALGRARDTLEGELA